jgi:hypothetical protein
VERFHDVLSSRRHSFSLVIRLSKLNSDTRPFCPATTLHPQMNELNLCAPERQQKQQQQSYWKQLCLRAFKFHGLSFKIEALKILLEYIEKRVAEDPSINVENLINHIVDNIDNQHCA